MGKPKKGKKDRREENSDDDDLEPQPSVQQGVNNDTVEEDNVPIVKAKQKKKKKKKENESDEEKEDGDASEKVTSKSAFELLASLDDDQGPDNDDKEDETAQPIIPQAAKGEVKGKADTKKKPKGKKKDKKQEDEEDIDAILAELAAKDVNKPQDNFKDISAMSQHEIAKMLEEQHGDDDEDDRRKKKKCKKDQVQTAQVIRDQEKPHKELPSTSKLEEEDEKNTAAHKKKEKKERQKQKKIEDKPSKAEISAPSVQKVEPPSTSTKAEEPPSMTAKVESHSSTTKIEAPEVAAQPGDKQLEEPVRVTGENEKPAEETAGTESTVDQKKKKKKKKNAKDEEAAAEDTKKKPSKMAQMILEQQRRLKEEEERLRREEEEKQRQIEEARRQREEQERHEKEKKEREKQKKKERIERQKKEGKYLTPKQKEDRRRAQEMLEKLKQDGVNVPLPGEHLEQVTDKKKRPIYTNKKKKPLTKDACGTPGEEASPVTPPPIEVPELTEHMEELTLGEEAEPEDDVADTWEHVAEDDIKDTWDVDESSEEEDSETNAVVIPQPKQQAPAVKDEGKKVTPKQKESSSEEETSEEETESSSESDLNDEQSKQPILSVAERIRARREAAERKRSTDHLRCPVVCVMGHVDTGKTKILDKLRRTNVQDGEAGGITQQIGATNVPPSTILEQTKMCKEFTKQPLKLPGLLIIDTPGHESFSNLRNRGSSLCDMAILVVDIMHGLEPQTLESIKLLRDKRCPFVIALNKIDRLYQWMPNPQNDIVNTLKKQKSNTKAEFDERAKNIIVQFAEQGLNACLFYDNKNPKEFLSMVPTSAHSGDGMGNLIALLCDLCQNMLAKKLAYSEELQATVMEVKALPGLGTTIDVILVNGVLRVGDNVVVPGTEGPIETHIRELLMPQPNKELRVKSQYEHHKEVHAAQGVKVIAKDLEKAVAGLPLHVVHGADEVEYYKAELKSALEDILSNIKLSEQGVHVQASTLGSLEALLQFLKDSKIPYSGINIGPVHKRDVMVSSTMLERDAKYAVILAFDVKVEREAQELADSLGIRIFQADIIYHLFDAFTKYVEEYKKKKQDEFKHLAVFPCKLRVLPEHIFNSRDPIVMGVVVEDGFVKVGTPICVPSKENVFLGHVASIEINHKTIEKATRGQEVCIKIENPQGETPKLYGRHFDHTDMLISKISRASIDAVKDYFRDEMSKNDWQLIVELKKLFEIL